MWGARRLNASTGLSSSTSVAWSTELHTPIKGGGGQLHSREGNKEFLLHKLILNTLQPLALGGETPQGSLIPLTDAVFIVVMTTSLPV